MFHRKLFQSERLPDLLSQNMLAYVGRAAERGGAEGVICPRASDIQGPPMLVVNAPMVRGGGLYPTVMPRASICLSAALYVGKLYCHISVSNNSTATGPCHHRLLRPVAGI